MAPFDYTSHHRRRDGRHTAFHAALLEAAPTPGARAGATPSERRTLVSAVREHLQRRLPDYMVPRQFVILNALPLTSVGKVAPRALPDPDAAENAGGAEFVTPRTELERTIARVWQELLGIGKVGIHDNFFDLGGHSLLIIRLQTRLREQLDVELSLTDLFQFPTVASLAGQLARVLRADESVDVVSPFAGQPGV
jgi:acyl carrier protein